MTPLLFLAEVAEKSAWTGFLGRIHPGVVHFPIALLSVAALFEVFQILKKRPEPAPGTLPMVVLAMLAAVAASFFGFMLEDYESTEGPTLDLHKWLGIASTVVTIVAALCAWGARRSTAALGGLRLCLILGSGLVLGTGYLGGELVFGNNHLFAPFSKKESSKTPETDGGKKPLLIPSPVSDKVDFVKVIAPILKDACWKCHGGEKTQGKLKITTKADAMKGGENGKSIIPGDPAKSSFYTLLLSKDPDERMPAKAKKPLPDDQISAIKKWIEQGAEWPADFVFAK